MFHVEHGASDTRHGRAERNGGTANHGTEAGPAMERRAGTARKGAEGAGRGRDGRGLWPWAVAARGGWAGGSAPPAPKAKGPAGPPPERPSCAVPARSGMAGPAAVEWFAVPQWSGARPWRVAASVTYVN